MMKKDLRESVDNLLNTGLFGKDVEDVFRATKGLITKTESLQKNNDNLIKTIIISLKALVGQNIYWASPNWKMETHTIRDVEYRIVDSDFFDTKETKYKGKYCVCIEVDDSGYYLADFIGKTLFFDKEEAMNHARKEV